MRIRNWLAAALLLFSATLLSAQARSLGPAEQIADGILLYRLGDPDLLNPPGPIATQALRLDSRKVSLTMGVAGQGAPARETVPRIAERTGAIAPGERRVFLDDRGAPERAAQEGWGAPRPHPDRAAPWRSSRAMVRRTCCSIA